jgi:Zinc carboxypeptidase
MYPWSHTCTPVADNENLFEAALDASKALRTVHGKTFQAGSICDLSYTASGGGVDWAYALGHVRWSFAFELRDLGTFGFLLPETE